MRVLERPSEEKMRGRALDQARHRDADRKDSKAGPNPPYERKRHPAAQNRQGDERQHEACTQVARRGGRRDLDACPEALGVAVVGIDGERLVGVIAELKARGYTSDPAQRAAAKR